jgi:hypothetical protein
LSFSFPLVKAIKAVKVRIVLKPQKFMATNFNIRLGQKEILSEAKNPQKNRVQINEPCSAVHMKQAVLQGFMFLGQIV